MTLVIDAKQVWSFPTYDHMKLLSNHLYEMKYIYFHMTVCYVVTVDRYNRPRAVDLELQSPACCCVESQQ